MKWLFFWRTIRALRAENADLRRKLTEAEVAITLLKQQADLRRADHFHRGKLFGYAEALAERELQEQWV